VGPMAYLALMTGTGTLTVVAFQLWQNRSLAELVCLPVRVIVAGFWGVAVYTIMLALAFGIAEPDEIGQVNLLNYLWPIWIVLLSTILFDDHPPLLPTLLGAMLGFGGVIVSRGSESLLYFPSHPAPHIMALTGGFLWALYCVLLKYWNIPEEKGATALNFGICSILAAMLAAYSGEWQTFPAITPEILFWVLFGGIGPVGLAYHWWEIGIKRGSVSLLSLLAYFIPIGSSLLIGLFFRESMHLGLILGAVMITIGALIVRRADETNKEQEKT